MTAIDDSKVVLITGGTSGIGKETALLMARKGWKVAVAGRRQVEGQRVVEEIKSAGGTATYVETDVNIEESVRVMIGSVIKEFGRLDAAVNNAGIANDDKPLADCSTEKFRSMWTTNVEGLFWCMQQEIKAMLDFNGGAIVNLASMAGLNGIPFSSTYVATKHAVVGLTKSAAIEYATQGVRVNAIAPGAIKTDILDYAIKSGAFPVEAINNMFPMKRMGNSIDIATGILFLIENQYTTGTILSVDGGFDAQ